MGPTNFNKIEHVSCIHSIWAFQLHFNYIDEANIIILVMQQFNNTHVFKSCMMPLIFPKQSSRIA